MTEPANAQVWVSSGFKPGADAQHETAYCSTSAIDPATGATSPAATDYAAFIASCSVTSSTGDTFTSPSSICINPEIYLGWTGSGGGAGDPFETGTNPTGICTIDFPLQQGVQYTINSVHWMNFNQNEDSASYYICNTSSLRMICNLILDPEGFMKLPLQLGPSFSTQRPSIVQEITGAMTGTGVDQIFPEVDCITDQQSSACNFFFTWQIASTSAQYLACSIPTITSVTPDGWWTSQSADITINGGCFLTSSDANGPSKVTVTDGKHAVTLSNINVVSSTQITATVNVTKKAPSETVTLTVTNPSGSATPGSAIANPAPVVLPIPVILWKNKTISGDDAQIKNPSVIVGQPVELTTTPATLPGGFTISNPTWTIPGTNVQRFSHPNSGIVLTPTQTDQPNTTYYWLYPQDDMNVVYTYCATDSNGIQICESPEAEAVFKAKSPGNLTLATDDSKLALVRKLDVCNPVGTEPFLEYGDLSGPAPGCGPDEGDPGIHLTASGASSGSYVFVQIVQADINEYTHATGPSPTYCGVHDGLDGGYPFTAVKGQNHQIAYDGPQMGLFPNDLTGTRNFHASMYLLWQSDEPKSIPVPIGFQDWQFVATAVQNTNGKWERHGILTASGDEGYPSEQPHLLCGLSL